MDITESAGYKSLLEAVERDERRQDRRDYRGKLEWAVARAQIYAQATGLEPGDILTAWETQRRYWYMNYYQDAQFPLPEGERVRVFETVEALGAAVGDAGFRCPHCGGVSRSPYTCDSRQEMEPGKVCDWKVWGLFRDLGKGVYVFVKAEMRGELIFFPVAWEQQGR